MLFGRPPDGKVMEVYNDFNSNLANLYSCVKEQTWEFLRDLGFLPLNSRDEFAVIRQFLEKGEFDARFMARELELAEHNLPMPEFEEIRSLMLENAAPGDVRRAAAFYKLIRYKDLSKKGTLSGGDPYSRGTGALSGGGVEKNQV